jgi:hypothetical protein
MLTRPIRFLLLTMLVGSSVGAPVPAADDADWPDWVDDGEALRQRIALVNEGELAFLAETPAGRTHHHSGVVRIDEGSLSDGWVSMEQCHRGLDRVQVAQILFREDSSRALEVVSFRNMDAAYPERNTIQLRGIREGSEVCVRAQTRALYEIGSGVYELRNGPFMRRFLDGYYPLQLSLRIEYPASIDLADFAPQVQPGFAVSQAPGLIELESLFEGRLNTRFRFLAR